MARSGWRWVLVWGSLLAALRPAAGLAVELRDFRMADHTHFTRLVFELDAPAEYAIERDPEAPALVVNLKANGQPQLERSWGPWVKRVIVEPLLDVTLVRVELREAEVEVVAERLEGPPRIVLDVGPGSSTVSLGDPTESTASGEPAVLGAPAGVEASPVDVAAPPPAAPAKPASPPPPLEPSRALPPDVDPERLHDPQSIAAQLSDAERVQHAQAARIPEPGGRLPGYGTFAALLVIALAGLFAWRAARMGGLARGVGAFRRWIVMLRRRVVVLRRRVAVLRRAQLARKRRGTREELKTPSPPAPGVSKDLPAIESSAPSAPPEDSMLDAPSEKEESLPPEKAAPPPPQPANGAVPDESQLEALGYRVEALEFALERALEGRERLEAQLVAQGEQLRVQLAALARTQRAVRALSRSRDPRRDDRGLRG